MFLIINKNTQRVFAIETARPPEGAYNSTIFDVKEWDGDSPGLANPLEGVVADLDPTLGDPAYQEKCQQRLDFTGLEEQAMEEIQWLTDTIPQIDIMTAAQVRSVVKRLARIILVMLKALRYVIRRLA